MPYIDIQSAIPTQQRHYARNISTPNVSFASAAMSRMTQEDRLCVDIVAGFHLLQEQQRLAVLTEAFSRIASILEEKMNEDAKTCGSTAVACISFLEREGQQTHAHIYTANLGDSCAYYLIRDKNTFRVKKSARMNVIHEPKNAEERRRVVNQGGYFTENDRLQGIINITRAFGDHSLKPYMSNQPDINHIKIPLAEDEELLIINASDGVSAIKDADSVILDGVDSATIALCANEITYTELPEKIMKEQRNGDNSTVVVHQLCTEDVSNNNQYSVPVLSGVFDGHNGEKVSEFVAQTLPALINDKTFEVIPPSENKNQILANLNYMQGEIVRDIKRDRYSVLINLITTHNLKIHLFNKLIDTFKYHYPLNNFCPLKFEDFEEMLEKMNQILSAHDKIDIHHNVKADKYLFFKEYSNSWQLFVKELRNHALQWLKTIVESPAFTESKPDLLQQCRANPIFNTHRANHWFQKIGRTSAVIEIDKMIEGLRQPPSARV